MKHIASVQVGFIMGIFGCSSPTGDPPVGEPLGCDTDGCLISGRVLGALAERTDVVVAALDASDWRFGDASPLSTLESWEPGDGRFTLRLSPSMPVADVYGKAFVAAWEDLDGDGRYDLVAEARCDTPAAGWDGAALYFDPLGSDPSGAAGVWSVGVDREFPGGLPENYTPLLDGDTCTRG